MNARPPSSARRTNSPTASDFLRCFAHGSVALAIGLFAGGCADADPSEVVAPPLGQVARDAAVPAAGGGASCAGDVLCADFEDQTGTTLTGIWSAVAPNCSGDGKIAIDQQVVHGGRRALRITSSGGYCNHVFATPKLAPGQLAGARWLRWYMRVSEPLSDAHVTFLAMHDKVSGKDLRMGGQSRILMWNRERDDATLPELSPTGIGLSAKLAGNTWHCLETHLDGARGTLETYLDGKRVEGLVIDQTPTPNVDGQWLRPGKWTAEVDDLRIGWESYGSQKMTLWIDDVAIAAARPGC